MYKLVNLLNHSFAYRYLAYLMHKWMCLNNPVKEINRFFKPNFGRLVDLENPKNLVEKIYWMELNGDLNEWSIMADKYRMREYVKSRGCECYLPNIYDVWHSTKDITTNRWDNLPSQFVIKANNGCGTVMIISDKSKVNLKKIRRKLNHWMAIPYGYSGCQLHYTSIKPCIIAEELLVQDTELDVLSPNSMVDYKVWCFNGKPESVLVTYNRTQGKHFIDLYDTNWNRIDFQLREHDNVHIDKTKVFPRPDCLDELLRVAAILSDGHPQIRVDFYIVDKRPVLGELTLSAGIGSYTPAYYDYLGSLTDLSLMKINPNKNKH